jgi:hypothetical protein
MRSPAWLSSKNWRIQISAFIVVDLQSPTRRSSLAAIIARQN